MNNFAFDLVLVIITGLSLFIFYAISRQQPQKNIKEIELNSFNKNEKKRSLFFPKKLIRQAGIISPKIKLIYWPIKILTPLLFVFLLLKQGEQWHHWVILCLASLIGFFSIEFWLFSRRKSRQEKIVFSLLYFVDLIIAHLKSGHSLQQAISTSIQVGFTKEHPLALEINLINSEVKAGKDFLQAFNTLWIRTGVSELRHLATVINVGVKMGSPILKTLDVQASILQDKQEELIEKKLGKKSIQMLLSMALTSLPIFFVLVLFPASVQVSEVFQILKQII